MHNNKELKIWNKPIDLVVKVHAATEKFRAKEKHDFTFPTRRSAVSFPSKISDGAGRNTKAEFKQFLGIAKNTSDGLQTQLIISNPFNLRAQKTLEPLSAENKEIQKMNYKLQFTIT